MELKRSLLSKWIDGVEKNLLSNPRVNGLNTIASLQFFLSLTIEYASSKANGDWLDDLLLRLFSEMKFFSSSSSSSSSLVVQRSSNEIHLMFLRLFTVLFSLIFKVCPDERDQYLHLSFFTAEQLRRTNLLDYSLAALQQVFEYFQEDHPPSIPLLKMEEQDLPLPDLSPFFYNQSSSSSSSSLPARPRQHHGDLFDCYPELLAEISNPLVY